MAGVDPGTNFYTYEKGVAFKCIFVELCCRPCVLLGWYRTTPFDHFFKPSVLKFYVPRARVYHDGTDGAKLDQGRLGQKVVNEVGGRHVRCKCCCDLGPCDCGPPWTRHPMIVGVDVEGSGAMILKVIPGLEDEVIRFVTTSLYDFHGKQIQVIDRNQPPTEAPTALSAPPAEEATRL